jgi:hypothetical protein
MRRSNSPSKWTRVVVFKSGGGAFRLITAIHHNRGIVIRKFLTRAEYSKEDWGRMKRRRGEEVKQWANRVLRALVPMLR